VINDRRRTMETRRRSTRDPNTLVRASGVQEKYDAHRKTPKFEEFQEIIKCFLKENHTFLLPNRFPYEDVFGSNHLVLWTSDSSPLKTDKDIEAYLEQHLGTDFEWLENPSDVVSITGIRHVQVFCPKNTGMIIYESPDSKIVYARVSGFSERQVISGE
jgi:hypothetical protein